MYFQGKIRYDTKYKSPPRNATCKFLKANRSHPRRSSALTSQPEKPQPSGNQHGARQHLCFRNTEQMEGSRHATTRSQNPHRPSPRATWSTSRTPTATLTPLLWQGEHERPAMFRAQAQPRWFSRLINHSRSYRQTSRQRHGRNPGCRSAFRTAQPSARLMTLNQKNIRPQATVILICHLTTTINNWYKSTARAKAQTTLKLPLRPKPTVNVKLLPIMTNWEGPRDLQERNHPTDTEPSHVQNYPYSNLLFQSLFRVQTNNSQTNRPTKQFQNFNLNIFVLTYTLLIFRN